MTSDVVYSGRQAHTAPVLAGAQQHFFLGAAQALQIGPGDTLFTYVYLDPKKAHAKKRAFFCFFRRLDSGILAASGFNPWRLLTCPN